VGQRLKLELKPEVAITYKSPSQRTRVITEKWGKENLYCLSCPSDSLVPTPTGKPVIDFTCPRCGERYQLKGKKHSFGNRFTNSAYKPKIIAIRKGTIPNFIFLRYDPTIWKVRSIFIVPKHFISESIIKRRKRLGKSARRAGWVGSEILLGNLPLDARIPIVKDEHEVPKATVRNLWNRFLFLRKRSVYSRGWLADVLACIRQLDKEIFTLADVYTFERQLAELHPINKHIRPKIRQQLQVLRDYGIVEFLGKGVYRIKKL
jgi:type II restriction enzyme